MNLEKHACFCVYKSPRRMNPQPKLDAQAVSININDLENWINLSASSMKYYSSKRWMRYQSIFPLSFIHICSWEILNCKSLFPGFSGKDHVQLKSSRWKERRNVRHCRSTILCLDLDNLCLKQKGGVVWIYSLVVTACNKLGLSLASFVPELTLTSHTSQ